MRRKKGTRACKSNVSTILFGVIFSFTALFIISFAFSLILMASENPGDGVGKISLAALLITAFISGFAVSKYKGEGGVKTSILTSFISAAVILSSSLILSKGNVGGGVFMNCLCYFMMASLAAFLSRKRERRHKRR